MSEKGSFKKEIDDLEKEGIDAVTLEKIKHKLNKQYSTKIEQYKDDYHKYIQTGRFMASTYLRRVKRGDIVAYINFETDSYTIEKVMLFDGVHIKTKTFTYPISLCKTIEIRLFSFPKPKKIYVHLGIANIYALNIASKVNDLADSVFLKHILKHQDKGKLKDKPLMQMLLAGAIGGLCLYFALVQVFKKVIVAIIGDLTLTPQGE